MTFNSFEEAKEYFESQYKIYEKIDSVRKSLKDLTNKNNYESDSLGMISLDGYSKGKEIVLRSTHQCIIESLIKYFEEVLSSYKEELQIAEEEIVEKKKCVRKVERLKDVIQTIKFELKELNNLKPMSIKECAIHYKVFSGGVSFCHGLNDDFLNIIKKDLEKLQKEKSYEIQKILINNLGVIKNETN